MSIKIQRRGWQETFTYREAILFLKSLASESLSEYWIEYDGKQNNGADFLENYDDNKIEIPVTNESIDFKITQNEEGALFFSNNVISIQITRLQFQKLLEKQYTQQLPINPSKAIQYYQNQLF